MPKILFGFDTGPAVDMNEVPCYLARWRLCCKALPFLLPSQSSFLLRSPQSSWPPMYNSPFRKPQTFWAYHAPSWWGCLSKAISPTRRWAPPQGVAGRCVALPAEVPRSPKGSPGRVAKRSPGTGDGVLMGGAHCSWAGFKTVQDANGRTACASKRGICATNCGTNKGYSLAQPN